MITISIYPWKICCDNIATLRAYEQIEKSRTDMCDCNYCLNFLKVRDNIYPASVKDFFRQLGIDYRKETEACQVHKIKQGWHYYMGWFHFIGSVERLEEGKQPHDSRFTELVKVDENFSWSFSNGNATHHEVFNGQQLGQIDFSANVPWVIDAKEPA